MGLDDAVDGVGGLGWGLGVALVAGAALLAGKGGRPLAKQAIKGYLVLSQRVREFGAEAGEQLQDIYAEVRAELGDDQAETNGQGSDLIAAPAATRRRTPKAKRTEA